ncbi:MAG TPA: deoxyribodipyrimidine photolyase [Saprospirales bacterium]|nr:deoxyribodipyrimidine photolyase [Saprospirales bacterium]HAY71079.1 deoxyribodipyrimidine photolyase [Saprospirales bacterium]
MQKVTVFWFRRDLRLHDNKGLLHALKSAFPVVPLFIFDPDILSKLTDPADKRVSIIYHLLEDINRTLTQKQSSLLVMYGKPEEVFSQLTTRFQIMEVHTNHDYEPYAVARDQQIATLLQKKEIPFFTYKDQVIFEKDDIVKKDGKPYTVFTPYSRTWKSRLTPDDLREWPSENLLHHFFCHQTFDFPPLSLAGFTESGTRLARNEINPEVIKNYDQTRNFPALQQGTSQMSVHLRFGTVSIRHLVKQALELNDTWLGELIWREFFMMILFSFPHVVSKSFKPKYDRIAWRNDEKEFDLWCRGETGYPMVDAGMKELNSTGLMHNRVRMVTASFLTKHLLIDWRWGEAYFAEKLLDYELSSNNGNWQWASGSGCDAAPYFRIFNPEEQQKRFDPDGIYIQKWLGPDWQQTIPPPIVDHRMARERALKVYGEALREE